MSVQAYPLQWPEGWPRATYRKRAKTKPQSLEQAETRFRQLAKIDHPDAGGNVENFHAINDAIQQARTELQ